MREKSCSGEEKAVRTLKRITGLKYDWLALRNVTLLRAVGMISTGGSTTRTFVHLRETSATPTASSTRFSCKGKIFYS